MGVAFLLGLIMDVADASLLGSMRWLTSRCRTLRRRFRRRLLWFPLAQQALHVLPLLLIVQGIQFVVRAMPGIVLPGLSYFVGPFVGAALWVCC